MMRVTLRDTKTGAFFNRPNATELTVTGDSYEVTADGETETFTRDRHVLLNPRLNPQGDDR